MHLIRSAFEYVSRAMFYAELPEKAYPHFKDLWNMAKRLNEGLD
jgi:hypothetical protein